MTMRWVSTVLVMGSFLGCGASKTEGTPRDGSVAVGDMGRRDTGMPEDDMGTPPTDTGIPDMVTPPGDTGVPPSDMGTPPDPDMGTPPDPDMGTPPDPDMGVPPMCTDPVVPELAVEDITTDDLSFPVFVTQAPGSADTLWVVQKTGLIRLVRGGSVLATPFLDLSSRVGGASSDGDERGLLSLAFHPGYAANGRFFVGYTPTTGSPTNVVAEYRRSAGDPDRADPAEVARLIATSDPEGNHNGGMVAFGPDGFLYAAIGDGGSGGDPHGPIGNGLDRNTLLGKLLRLDTDAAASGYAAAGNPFSPPMGLPQVWAYGLRNPWRFSFDRGTGDLYMGDVGQDTWEEIDVQPSTAAGLNYGWRAYEGDSVYDSDLTSLVPEHAAPAVVNRHFDGSETLRDACSITGGYVYRGAAIPALQGIYLFGDYCSSDVAAFRFCGGEARGLQRVSSLRAQGSGLVSFGEDNAGELYIVYQNDARVARIVAP